MLVPIQINSQDIMDSFSISKKEVDDIIDVTIKNIAAAFAVEWENVALNTLHSTKQRYVANLKVIDSGRMSGAVVLDYSKDKLIKMLEEGATAFDLKKFLLASPKAKQKKNGGGKYITVPFSIGSPSANSDNFSTILPSQVYTILKNQAVMPTTSRSQGLVADQLPDQFQKKQTRAGFSSIPTSKLFEEYQHKNSIYEGVYKKKDTVTGQNSYGSFRRVSDKSDSNSWIHPGIDQGNLAEKAYGQFETKLQVILEDSMSDSLKFFGLE